MKHLQVMISRSTVSMRIAKSEGKKYCTGKKSMPDLTTVTLIRLLTISLNQSLDRTRAGHCKMKGVRVCKHRRNVKLNEQDGEVPKQI